MCRNDKSSLIMLCGFIPKIIVATQVFKLKKYIFTHYQNIKD